MASGYKATVYVESGKIGHAFIKLEAPGQPAITVGYYPIVSSPEGPGTVKNDAITGPVNPRTKELSQHDGEPIKSFNIDANQYASMIGYVNHVANNPGGYGLVGNQCTSFVVDTLSKGGITNDNHLDNFAVVHPTALIPFLKPLDVNQIIDPNATINSAQITANISGINQGIATHHPQDPNYQDALNNRIAPVGTVVFGSDTTSTPTTILSPDGRNSLDPRRLDLAEGGGGAGAAPEEKPTTVFNPTTALPTNKGEYTVTVQPGDTVSSIAAKLGMSAKEYSDFLQSEYGFDADLNSIVAGRQLPVPKDVHDKLTGADLDPTNPNGKNAVNGSDKQSDDAAAKREGEEAGQKYGDFGEDKTQTETPAFTPIVATADLPPDQIITLADSGNGTQTDGGNTTGYGNDSENSSNTDTNTPVVGVNTN